MRRISGQIAAAVVLGALSCAVSMAAAQEADLTSAVLVRYLENTVDWYRLMEAQRQMLADSEETGIFNDNQQTAGQVVSLAFDFARSEADSIDKAESADQGDGGSRYRALKQALSGLEQQVRSNQLELDGLRQKIAGVTGRERESLQARIAETQSELELAQVRRDSLRSMADFVGGTSANGVGATGVREKVETMARSIPGAFLKTAGKQEMIAAASPPRQTEPTGVWALTADIVTVRRKSRTLGEVLKATDALRQESRNLRTPYVTTLRELSKRGDELAAMAESTDQVVLVQEKAMLDALTAQFKRTSASVLPLTKQGILLDVYRKNVANWQESLDARYARELRTVMARLALLVVVLTVIIGGSELWRRAIARYVREPRRRYQYLLLRKIVFWCIVAVVLLVSFANELSSVATFAGLITAGVAVALQNVIVSVVAYFFLIGKYGIRVGDRVQVAGVTGEVVDIGLVRFHLLELISGGDKTASGRVVGFSNSVVFQSNAGFYKQIPGTNFVWHEVALSVAPDKDYRLAETRLLQVVAKVFAEYRDEMEKQHRHMERTLTTAPAGTLSPTSRLHLGPSGLEVLIRYPVDLMHASDIDDRVTRELLGVIASEPALSAAAGGKTTVRLKTDISG
jgi:small-conductance mechanosensitive channel